MVERLFGNIFSGGEQRPRNPYYDLLSAVYLQAINDLKKYDAGTREFGNAAVFLTRDPYGILDARMKGGIDNLIWDRREERRKAIEGGIENDS